MDSQCITILFPLSKNGLKRKVRRRSYDRHPVGEEKPEEELMGRVWNPAPPSTLSSALLSNVVYASASVLYNNEHGKCCQWRC